MTLSYTNTPTIYLLYLLITVVRCEYGCRLSLSNCSSNGVCRDDGVCICNELYIGDNCEVKVALSFIKEGLNKNSITGWVFFWVIVSITVPYIIYLVYLISKGKKNKENILYNHFRNVLTALCCVPYDDGSASTKRDLGKDKSSKNVGKESKKEAYEDKNKIGENEKKSILEDREVNIVQSEENENGLMSNRNNDIEYISATNHNLISRVYKEDGSHIACDIERMGEMLDLYEGHMQENGIELRKDTMNTFKDIYSYDLYEGEDLEELSSLIQKDEEKLKITNPIKYNMLINHLYK